MRVLLVHEVLSSIGGGSQTVVFTWIKNLKRLGVEVKLLCNKPINMTLLKYFSPSDVIINKSINLSIFYPQFSFAPFIFPETIDEIKKFNPQIIHFNESFFIALRLHKIASKLKIKTLSSYHTNFALAKVNRFPLSLIFKKRSIFPKIIDKIQLFILSKSNFVTVPSKTFQKFLSQKIDKKTFLLPEPIPSCFFQKKIQPCQKINKLITVSRLSGEKNIDALIEIMNYLRGKFRLTIVGEGIDRVYLEKKVKKLKLENDVKFTGWIRNEKLPSVLKKHHLFISSSDYETFGITYIEALAAGIPCVVFDCPVTREIIPSSMAIFIKNLQPKKWANILLKIQNNPHLFNKLKQNISKDYKKLFPYHELNSTKQLVKIYKTIIG